MSPAFDASATSNQLDSVDYNPIDHLNALFSDPSTLLSVNAVSDTLQTYRNDLDDEIAELVTLQAQSNLESVGRIQATKSELADLLRKIEGVRERAMQTEQAITDMTADIKRLDGTKRNLALSMTALKRLQMLTTAYEQLRGLSRSRQYRECAQLLQAVIQLMAHFKSYRSIDQIATLSRDVADLQRELQEQICEDFELAFAKGEVQQRRVMLSEACLVIEALGENSRLRLINWYCNTQLREYRQIFRGNSEAGSLDNISRRYAWFKRMLKTYDDEHAVIFPTSWKVDEVLANSFCEGTRDDFKGMLSRSMRRINVQGLDVDLLLSCLQQTLDFEQYLEHRFTADSRASIDTLSSKDDKSLALSRVISEAFEPYLSLWVDSQDRQLSELIPSYRQQLARPVDEDFSAQSVIPSSIELFHFYRVSLAQCAKLSTGNWLLELSKTFAKYLYQYAEQVLLGRVSEARPGKEPALEDIILVLNTADYCHNTCTQLEERIRSRIDADLKGKVDLQSQQDAFMGVASAAIRSLVRRVVQDCESAWREMRNIPWSKLDNVGDQSSYVGELLDRVRSRTGEILRLLHKQQYARAFCDNVVEVLANTYLANVAMCKPVSETGAEQMLLDSYVLKKGFGELLTLNADSGTVPPSGYIKRVNQSMAKLDPLLKTLQVRSSPAEGLVQAYIIHIGDRSDSNFRKILELKGIRKSSEQATLLELFHAHTASQTHLIAQSPLLTPLNLHSSSSSSSSSATASSLSSAQLQFHSRFDPSTLGSAIVSAAREGVDRLGVSSASSSPSLGSAGFLLLPNSNTPSNATTAGNAAAGTSSSSTLTPAVLGGTTAPAAAAAAAATATDLPSTMTTTTTTTNPLNENLRNIGRFFKRDLSGLGGRFGGGGGGGGG